MSERDQPGAICAPLPVSVRMSDQDYPGVVRRLGPVWRLAVSTDCRRYVLQSLVQTDSGGRWVTAGGRQSGNRARLLDKFGARVEGLAEACDGLPENPAHALPEFAARVDALADELAATDWARDSYAGEVARDGSLRLVVTPCRSAYRLQWVAERDIGTGADWRTVCTAASLSEVWQFVNKRVGSIDGPGMRGVLRGDDVEPRWLALVAGLPDLPSQVHRPGLPAPRSCVQASARNASEGA